MDILITEEIDSPALERLAKTYRLVRDGSLWRHPAELQAMLKETRAVIVRNQTQLTSDLLKGADNLLGIGRHGVGLDNLDLHTASKLGIVVIAPLGTNATSVAEHTFALMLALSRKLILADRSTKSGSWNRLAHTGTELDGKTLLIVGFGRIGRRVAIRAHAFGMRILVFDPLVAANLPELGKLDAVWHSQIEDALPEADLVTLHVPLTAQTRNFFGARLLKLMKRSAFLINTSRGEVVDEPALVAALRGGSPGGAALDVRQVEPPGAESELEGMDNVILTPHIASFTVDAQTRTGEAVAGDIDRLLKGLPVVNYINFPMPQKAHLGQERDETR